MEDDMGSFAIMTAEGGCTCKAQDGYGCTCEQVELSVVVKYEWYPAEYESGYMCTPGEIGILSVETDDGEPVDTSERVIDDLVYQIRKASVGPRARHYRGAWV